MKRNPAPASAPNAAVDLTPLLDVIFILLFVVLLSLVQLSEREDASRSQQVAELQTELDELNAELAEYRNRDYDYETVAQSYQASIQQYEELDKAVIKITVFCNYDPDDYSRRTIRILVPGREDETIELSSNHSETGFARLEALLEECIVDAHIQQQGAEDEIAETETASFVVICLSLDQIQYRDRGRIDEIAAMLTEKYENVYYRKFRADQ